MQIKSADGAMTVDYYEVKDFLGDVKKNLRLRVVTFLGRTIERRAVNVYDMAEEIDDLLELNYEVTINTKRPPQFVPQWSLKEVAQSRTRF